MRRCGFAAGNQSGGTADLFGRGWSPAYTPERGTLWGMLAAARRAGPPIPANPDTPSFNNVWLLIVENLPRLTTFGCCGIMSLQNRDCNLGV